MEYRYASTPIRLAAWRKYAAEITARYLERGAPAPAEYAPGTLPPAWFGAISPASVNREPYESDGRTARTPTYNYGDSLGGNISRPFRFVGFADEVPGVRIRHRGWYADEHGYTIYRGAVFQIPARGGNPQYLAGVEWGESSPKGFDSGGGWIAIGRGNIYKSKEDAARAADSMAEYAAERAREEDAAERERIREEEEEAKRKAEEEEAEHSAKVAAALERVLRLAGEVANATGEPGALPTSSPLRPLIDALEEALEEYDSLMAEPADNGRSPARPHNVNHANPRPSSLTGGGS
jgi:hypothetical protein